MKLFKELLSESTSGTPLEVLVQYMKKKGYKSFQIDGGSYGYSTTLAELSKPKIKWSATDGSPVTTKTVAEISGWLDSHDDWDSYWEQDRVDEMDLLDLADSYISFSKDDSGEYGNQEDWESR